MNAPDWSNAFPAKVGYRRFHMTVENGCGDEGTVRVYVRDARSPRQYAAQAISKARAVLPNEGPWKLNGCTEV